MSRPSWWIGSMQSSSASLLQAPSRAWTVSCMHRLVITFPFWALVTCLEHICMWAFFERHVNHLRRKISGRAQRNVLARTATEITRAERQTTTFIRLQKELRVALPVSSNHSAPCLPHMVVRDLKGLFTLGQRTPRLPFLYLHDRIV